MRTSPLSTVSEAFSFLERAAPAAMATRPHSRVSDRYQMVPTTELVRAAYDRGLNLVSAYQQPTKANARSFDRNSARHELRFLKEGHFSFREEGTPEVTVTNSHAANSTFQLKAGIYRKVCSNGMIARVGGSRAFRHIKGQTLTWKAVEDLLQNCTDEADAAADKVTAFQGTPVDPQRDKDVVCGLVDAGVKARWGSWDKVPENNKRCARDFVAVRRFADNGQDLWTTVNVVQENLVRGTRKNWSVTGKKVRRIRPCNDISTQQAISESLWAFAETVAAPVPAGLASLANN